MILKDNKEMPFTLYWLDGKREIIYGETTADAFSAAGYGGGAISALDFKVDGADCGYRYEDGKWVKKERIRFQSDALPKAEEVAALLEHHGCVEIELPSKDLICLDLEYGHYFDGWCKHARVYFAGYCAGSYFEDGDEECHYMVSGTFWYDPSNVEAAIGRWFEGLRLWLAREDAKHTINEVSARKEYENYFATYDPKATAPRDLIRMQETLPL